MDNSLIWDCCTEDQENGKDYIQCFSCKKAHHLNCLLLLENNDHDPGYQPSSPWTCSLCKSPKPTSAKNDNTPAKLNPYVTIRPGKRQATGSPPGTAAVTTTSAHEIHDIVQEVIKKEIGGMLTIFSQTMSKLINTELKSVKDDINDLKKSMDYMNKDYEEMIKEYQESKKTMNELQIQNDSMRSTIKDITTRLNYLEQNSRNNNLEIQCVPEKRNENLLNILNQVGKTIGSVINEEHISHCTRVAKVSAKSDRPRSIVVQFISPRQRDEFLAAAINYNKPKPVVDKLNSSHLGFSGENKPIFITEHLSPANKALHAAARTKGKEKGYKYVWVRNGRIYMRKSDDSEYKLIKDIEALDKID